VHARSLAVALLLVLAAAGGILAVRELTRPTPPKAVPPIELQLAPEMPAERR
jgi:hypothetical protein